MPMRETTLRAAAMTASMNDALKPWVCRRAVSMLHCTQGEMKTRITASPTSRTPAAGTSSDQPNHWSLFETGFPADECRGGQDTGGDHQQDNAGGEGCAEEVELGPEAPGACTIPGAANPCIVAEPDRVRNRAHECGNARLDEGRRTVHGYGHRPEDREVSGRIAKSEGLPPTGRSSARRRANFLPASPRRASFAGRASMDTSPMRALPSRESNAWFTMRAACVRRYSGVRTAPAALATDFHCRPPIPLMGAVDQDAELSASGTWYSRVVVHQREVEMAVHGPRAHRDRNQSGEKKGTCDEDDDQNCRDASHFCLLLASRGYRRIHSRASAGSADPRASFFNTAAGMIRLPMDTRPVAGHTAPMKKIRVGIVFGGRSAEHEVSLQSAKNVLEALDRQKYEPVLIGIDREGRWRLDEQTKAALRIGASAAQPHRRFAARSGARCPRRAEPAAGPLR